MNAIDNHSYVADIRQLAESLREANARVLELEAKLSEYQWLEGALRQRTRELNERVKELECLYAISNILKNDSSSLSDMLQQIIDCIPKAYQAPERTFVCLILPHCMFYSFGFLRTTCCESVLVRIRNVVLGELQVFCTEALDSVNPPKFSKEEQILLQTIATWIGYAINRAILDGSFKNF